MINDNLEDSLRLTNLTIQNEEYLSVEDTPMEQSLEQIPILDYFDEEINLITIYDVRTKRIVYENSVFSKWKKEYKNESTLLQLPSLCKIYECSRDSPASNITYDERAWRITYLKKRWMILTSFVETNVENIIFDDRASTSSYPTTSSQDDDSVHDQSTTSCSSTKSNSIFTFYKTFDWTKHDVPGLSAHVLAIKNYPWHNTSIGGIDTWPDIWRSAVIAANSNSEPRMLFWGSDYIMIYNEACAPLFGIKHPHCMGAKAADTWGEAWALLSGFISRAEMGGKATRIADMAVPMERYGYDEETFWITNFVPIIGPKGKALAILDEFTDTTQQVIQERRRDIVVKTSEMLSPSNTLEELWNNFVQGITRATDDIPYAVIYIPTNNSHHNPISTNAPSAPLHSFTWHVSVGIKSESDVLPKSFDLNNIQNQKHECFIKACNIAWKSSDMIFLESQPDATHTLPPHMSIGVPGRSNGGAVKTVCVFPIPDLMGNNQLAFVVLALTPRRPFDAGARLFIRSFYDVLTRSASIIFLPEEQRRNQQRFVEIETSLSQQLRANTAEAERVEARYERAFQMAPVGIFSISPEERLLYHNNAYLACHDPIYGSISDDPPSKWIHFDDVDRVRKHWSYCLEEKQPITLEYRLIKPWRGIDITTGKEISGETWVLTSASPEFDTHGNVVHVMGWMLDISERKYHEKKQSERIEEEKAEARFASLAQAAPMGMYLLKPDGHPIYLNDAYFNIVGMNKEQYAKSEDCLGGFWADRIHPDDKSMVKEAWKLVSEQGIPFEMEYRVNKAWRAYDNATGTEMTGPTWLQGTAFAIRDDTGAVVTIQGFVTEISMKKFSERLLAERLEEALETKRQADRFIDVVSHEIRNPLSAILQAADGILSIFGCEDSNPLIPSLPNLRLSSDVPLSAELIDNVVDSTQTIVLCAQHQKRIVDDILTLSKLDSNLLIIFPDRVSLPALIEKCLKMYESDLKRADIQANLRIENDYKTIEIDDIMADGSRILQVIINLLTNAIKFTQHSNERRITIYLNGFASRPNVDNHKAKYIEQRPNRPDPTANVEWGTGQELYLQISVQDSGKGLDDEELKLLFHRFSQASPKTYKQYGGSGLGLFISRELTELQGGQIGVYSRAGAGSIFTFYIKARRADTNDDRWSIDGSQVLSLKELSANNSRTTSRDGTLCMNNNVTISPILSQAIHNNMSSSIHPLSKSTSTPSAAPKAVLKKKELNLHVLIVEDNEINQRVMATQLRQIGCIVSVAGNGQEALDFLMKTHLYNHITTTTDRGGVECEEMIELDIILMDLEMPVLGGIDTIKKIRNMQKEGTLIKHVPVIAVTANARNEQINHAVKCGMDSVVTKPFRIPELVPQMEELVGRLS